MKMQIAEKLLCTVQVGWLKAGDQTILALHKRVITHNQRVSVSHEDSRVGTVLECLMPPIKTLSPTNSAQT